MDASDELDDEVGEAAGIEEWIADEDEAHSAAGGLDETLFARYHDQDPPVVDAGNAEVDAEPEALFDDPERIALLPGEINDLDGTED